MLKYTVKHFTCLLVALVLACGFLFSGITFPSFEGDNVSATVKVDIPQAHVFPSTVTIDEQIATGADDTQAYGSTFAATSTTNYYGYYVDRGNNCHGTLRFPNVTINGTVTAAYIQLYCTYQDVTKYIRIHGDASDNPTAPTNITTFNTVMGRLTSENVTWNTGWTTNAWSTSPSLVSIFQKLSDDYSIYDEAVQIVLVGYGTTSYQMAGARSYEYTGNAHGAKLHIEYNPIGSAVISTGGQNSVTGTTANVSGSVTDIGGVSDVTNWGTEYGTTTSYGSTTNNSGTQSSPFNWTDLLSDLMPETTYHYRSWATNAIGTAVGLDASFTTTESDAIYVSEPDIYPNFQQVGFDMTYNGDSNENVAVVARWKPTAGGDWKLSVDPDITPRYNSIRFIIIGLSPNTEYDYEITISDGDGVASDTPMTGSFTTRNDVPDIEVDSIYVAKDGNDSTGNGTEGNPYLTISKAATVVTLGQTVIVKEGIYEEMVTCTVDGDDNDYVTFMANPGDTVTVTGNSTRNKGFYLNDADFNRIKGFTVRDTLQYGIHVYNSTDCIIEYNNVLDCNYSDPQYGDGGMIEIDGLSNRALVQYNTINGEWEGETNITSGIGVFRTEGQQVYRYNYIYSNNESMRDGVGSQPEDETGYLICSDIYSNNITGMHDDGIQWEGTCYLSTIWDNNISKVLQGIAIAPTVGRPPIYVYRNRVWSTHDGLGGGFMKLGHAYYVRIYAYHNSYYATDNVSDEDGSDGLQQTNYNPGTVVSRNNAFYVSRYIYELTDSRPAGWLYDFDYNLIESSSPSNKFIKWYGQVLYSNLTAFSAASGQDTHSRNAADFGWADPVNGDFTIGVDSPCTDNGTFLQGFNDTDSAWPYEGSAPDIGAEEYDYTEYPPNPPVMTSSAVTLRTDTSARLNGAVADLGGSTNCTVTFVWDTSDQGSSSTNDWSNNATATSPSQPQVVASCYYDVTGLTTDETYYFRVTGLTDGGVGWSDVISFIASEDWDIGLLMNKDPSDILKIIGILRSAIAKVMGK